MSLAAARRAYAATARVISDSQTTHLRGRYLAEAWRCPSCQMLGLQIEAESLAIDLGEAEASSERLRRSVAW